MKSTLKILCLEDQESDFDLLSYVLQHNGLNFQAKRVDTRGEFIDAIKKFQPDIILSDHSLPQFNSNEALKICLKKAPTIPFILVTGAVSDEFAVNCIKEGATDYVLKSHLTRLPTAIKNALKQKRTESQKRKAFTELAVQNNALTKINAELDSFVYSVSHNLRAPLMSVLGLLNLAKHEDSIYEIRKYHTMMEGSIKKLDDTLKEILDYSRNARQDVKLETIDIESIIQDNLKRVQFMPGYQRLKIETQIDSRVTFLSDFYRLDVIANNLISNAVKYHDTTKHESYLNVSVKTSDSFTELVFEDNGIGISESHQPHIFNMFFRANDSREGSGLGLYIVKEAVEKLNGHIHVESKLGKGTKFTITIPNNKEH